MSVGAVAIEDPVLEMLSGAREMLHKVALSLSPTEVWKCSPAAIEQMLLLQQDVESVAAAIGLLVVREADVRGLAAADGQPSTQRWLAHKLTLQPGEAQARVKTADRLCRKAPDTLNALIEGKVNPDQAAAIAKGLDKIDPNASPDELADAEKLLLRDGIGLHAGHITRLARYIESCLDPDGDPGRAQKAMRSRGITITDLGGGQHRIRGILTDEATATLKAAMDPLAAPRPAVKGPNGEPGEPDPRTAEQRRHDALQEIAARTLRFGDLGESHGVRPHVSIIATVENAHGETGPDGKRYARTATGEDIDLDTLRRIMCDAGITPIIANTLGEPLAVGREKRTATPAQWKALLARDIGCIGEGCTRPASWCEAHHFPPWEDGGQTDVDKMALVCSYEHHKLHHDGWEIRLADDGHPEMIPPKWIDSDQRPRRNAHWKLIRNGLKQPPDPAPREAAEPESSEPDRGP